MSAPDADTFAEMCDRLSVPPFVRPALSDWLAARDAQVRAEALREAADASRQPPVARWLRARADREEGK